MYLFNSKVSLSNSSIRLGFLWVVFLSISVSVKAQTIPSGFNLVVYEGFNYGIGTSLLNANGGNGWASSWGQSYSQKYLKTSATGFTYTGLTTQGYKADFDATCYGGTCNQIAAMGRSFPLQDKGVVYFQFISVFEAAGGGGTPSIRLFNGANLTGGIGAGSGSLVSILDVDLNNLGVSSGNLSTQNLVVVRIDYNLNKTEMWVNPNLSTFDYSNPTSPSATATGFAPAFDRMDIFLRSGSIDEISIFSQPTSAPTSISGTTTVCSGTSTTLTSTGGGTAADAVDVWYEGACGGDAFHQGWDTQPYTTLTTTVNSNLDGILNVTSTSVDPGIAMYNLGSFNPAVYKYINFRYKVDSGTAGAAQIFFLNSAITVPDGGYYLDKALISDNAWHIATIDMSAHANWIDSNITGWRFDYATASGATMNIDFIELGTSPIVGAGTSINITPNASTTYFVKRKGPNANTACISQLVTVNSLPTPTFVVQPSAITTVNTNVTYTTESGQSNYAWTISGVLNVDYSIISGGTTADNTLVLQWLTTGSKAVTVNYNNLNNCSAVVATSSTPIITRRKLLNRNGQQTLVAAEEVNKNGAIGLSAGMSSNGENILITNGDGLTAATAATSAYQIKQDYPSSSDGVYWIINLNINGGAPFQIYADMTTDGGGWMLLNVGKGGQTSSEMSTVTDLSVKGYLPRTTVIELAMLCSDVQLRSGNSSSSYANKATSNNLLAIEALRSSSTVAGGTGTWHSNSLTNVLFATNTGTWCWNNCCVPDVTGWPQMYHSNNYAGCVHWYVDLGYGRNSAGSDAWFSTWIR